LYAARVNEALVTAALAEEVARMPMGVETLVSNATNGEACKGKVRHETSASARLALHFLNMAKGYQGPMDAYGCQFCGCWHIGHRPGRK